MYIHGHGCVYVMKYDDCACDAADETERERRFCPPYNSDENNKSDNKSLFSNLGDIVDDGAMSKQIDGLSFSPFRFSSGNALNGCFFTNIKRKRFSRVRM